MGCQFIPEFLGGFGISVVVVAAPLNIRLMDLASGNGTTADFAPRPVAHTLLEEGDNRAVGCLIL